MYLLSMHLFLFKTASTTDRREWSVLGHVLLWGTIRLLAAEAGTVLTTVNKHTAYEHQAGLVLLFNT